MVLMLPEAPRRKNAGNILAEGLGGGFNQGFNQQLEFAQKMAAQKEANQGKFMQTMMQERFKKELEHEEKVKNLAPAVDALDIFERLIKEPGIGVGTKFNPFSGFGKGAESRKNVGEFKAAQAAIMPLFKTMFPRGMTNDEFKIVNATYIPQHDDSEATIEGKLKSLRSLLDSQITGVPGGQSKGQSQGERPPLSSFSR